jgi:hypothetical protein
MNRLRLSDVPTPTATAQSLTLTKIVLKNLAQTNYARTAAWTTSELSVSLPSFGFSSSSRFVRILLRGMKMITSLLGYVAWNDRDSNINWAQQLRATKQYLDHRGVKDCWFASFGEGVVDWIVRHSLQAPADSRCNADQELPSYLAIDGTAPSSAGAYLAGNLPWRSEPPRTV